MRIIIAIMALFALFAGTASAQVSRINTCSQEVMEQNNLTEAEARNLPTGYEYTYNGNSYRLETYGDTIWNDCQTEILPALLSVSQTQTIENEALNEEVQALQNENSVLRRELSAARELIRAHEQTIQVLRNQPATVEVRETEIIPMWMYFVFAAIVLAFLALFFWLVWNYGKTINKLEDEHRGTLKKLNADAVAERERHIETESKLHEERKIAQSEAAEAREQLLEKENALAVEEARKEDLSTKLKLVQRAARKAFAENTALMTIEFDPSVVSTSARKFEIMLFKSENEIFCSVPGGRKFPYSPEQLRKEVLRKPVLEAIQALYNIQIQLPDRERGWMQEVLPKLPDKKEARDTYNSMVSATNSTPLRKVG